MPTNVEIATRRVASTNPATGELLRELDCASDAEVHAAVAQARSAQPAWAALSVEERIRILRKFQRLLHENKTEVATLITQEAGKPYVEALLTEVLVVLDAARFLIDNAFLHQSGVLAPSAAMSAAITVPEPASIGATGLILLGLRRRRRRLMAARAAR